MTAVRITLIVDLVERDGQVIFSTTDTEVRPTPLAGELRGVNGTIDRAGKQLVNRVADVFSGRFG